MPRRQHSQHPAAARSNQETQLPLMNDAPRRAVRPRRTRERRRSVTTGALAVVAFALWSSLGLTSPLSGTASGRSPLAKVRLDWLVGHHPAARETKTPCPT